MYFYPRSPCGERPSKLAKTSWTEKISIHALLAESDALASKQNATQQNFYPRSPCGERQEDIIFEEPTEQISIHALLAESDQRT